MGSYREHCKLQRYSLHGAKPNSSQEFWCVLCSRATSRSCHGMDNLVCIAQLYYFTRYFDFLALFLSLRSGTRELGGLGSMKLRFLRHWIKTVRTLGWKRSCTQASLWSQRRKTPSNSWRKMHRSSRCSWAAAAAAAACCLFLVAKWLLTYEWLLPVPGHCATGIGCVNAYVRNSIITSKFVIRHARKVMRTY